MSVGERIKLARKMRKMSQRDLARKVSVSYQAISNYEMEKNVPSSGVLLELTKALDVKLDFFLRSPDITLSEPLFRKKKHLRKRDEKAIMAKIQDWIERYSEVEGLVMQEPLPPFRPPESVICRISALEDTERVAVHLREAWDLGLDPIDNLTEILEEHNVKIGVVSGHPDNDFDAVTFSANNTPVIALNESMSGDRQRFSLAHELGHLVLECPDYINEHAAVNRFAGAFLVPARMARAELGMQRQYINIRELELLKQKYGLSIAGWVYRAKDLGIIGDSTTKRLWRLLRSKGWDKKEPGEPYPPEKPKRMERITMKAVGEGIISEERAAELLATPVRDVQDWVEGDRS